MKHTISVLVENEFGVLTRVSGMFSGRGFNIQSLTVAETLDPAVSRITLVTSGKDDMIEQIEKQLNKLVNVIKVQEMTPQNALTRDLALVKVSINQRNRAEVLKAIELIGGKILDVDEAKHAIVEICGEEEKVRSALNLLKPFGIIDYVQTGTIAIQTGKQG